MDILGLPLFVRKAPKNKDLRSFEGTLGPFAEADLPSCTAWVRGPSKGPRDAWEFHWEFHGIQMVPSGYLT